MIISRTVILMADQLIMAIRLIGDVRIATGASGFA